MRDDESEREAFASFTIGCLGAREMPLDAAAACRKIAADLVRGGYTVVTGAPPGEPGREPWANWADASFAYGAARIDPTRLTVCLPWRHFPHGSADPPPGIRVHYPDDHPEWTESAAGFWGQTHHSAAHFSAADDWAAAVPRAPRLRHTRNVGIVRSARMVLAWPDAAGEETGFALAYAAWAGVPTLDLTQTAWWTVAPTLVARLRAATADLPRLP